MTDFAWNGDSEISSPNPIIQKALNNILVGELLGTGAYRKVFANKQKPKQVIKIESGARCFSNIREHEMWWAVINNDELNKWFAPVVDISPCGAVLIMKRTTPVTMKDMPKKIPNFFSDLKIENWGWHKGRIVCHDYGNNLALHKGLNNWKLKKAHWWSEND